jgi:polyketide-type polyunsaturated fatty acid synthase PfaA
MAEDKAGNKSADIALIGMACLFPGAKDARRYWQNVCRGVDAVREVPSQRWRAEDFYSDDRLAPDRVYSRWGAFLDPVVFDPVKWHIPPASLRHIEPMQLLSLEVAWQAMVDAGYDPLPAIGDPPSAKDKRGADSGQRTADWRERAGVLFAVPGSHELGTAYCFRTMMRHYLPKAEGLSAEMRERIYASLEEQLPQWSEDSFPGFLGNVIAGRIAREFDFHGPNYIVDAACAASLAALFTAVQLLRSGTADLMLVGGADGTNNPFGFMSFAKTHALSPRGKSRAFDAGGDGIALGEGIAAVVLKRLADAERDGDKIYAVIKGVGSSSDGKNRSLTAPHPPGQMRAVQRAYEDAGISPATVTLIEAHGTGTAVGDSAELTTLTQVFAPHLDRRQYVAVGSVKSMIGHTKTVAGLASLIKAALALKHRVLPPTLHVEKPNDRVDLENSPFYLNTETRPWMMESDKAPRRAGVSSFGFGGTNFHVVLEEHNGGEPNNWTPRASEVFLFQRASRAEMLRDLRQLHQQLGDLATDDLAGLAAAVFADESNRAAAPCRMGFVSASVEDFRHKLDKAVALLDAKNDINDPSGIYYSEAAPLQAAHVCFLYPGQGSQSVNALRDLVMGCPWNHELFLEANRLLQDDLPQPLTSFLYPPPVFDAEERERQQAALRDTRIAQPVLAVLELFATELLERFGIRPAFAAGHSYGEHVALHVAGCLSRTDLLRLSAYRGRVCAEAAAVCPGVMASVQASAAEVETALRELNVPARLANRNGPDQTVIAGPADTIEAAIETLSRRGLRTRKLSVSAAFHTPLLSAAAEAMGGYLAGLRFERQRLPVYSNTTGQRHAKEPESIRALLARHLCEPVLFEQEIRQLGADGARVFIEVGPGRVLADLVSRILSGEPIAALALDVPGRDGWTQFGHLLARLSVMGLPVRLAAWIEGRGLTSDYLTEFLARTRAAAMPKPTDWILSPNKAEPVTPLPKRNERKPGEGARRFPEKASVAFLKPEKVSAAMTTTNGEMHPPPSALGTGCTGADLFAQFQATTRLLLEAQQAQNRLLERYLETQERLLLHCSSGAEPTSPPALAPLPPRLRPPVPIPRAAAAPPRPLTVSPAPSPRPSPSTTNGARVNSSSQPSSIAKASSSVTKIDGPPLTETFRRDLLEVVSARTGYPIDALDENLALEAELGIDSIKTVEIFSNLKAYHAYFRAEEQEEEELLAEFTKLKTLRDIIDSYDRRRQALLAPAAGAEQANGSVQRYRVTSIAAPRPECNGEKKNRTDGSS